MATIPKKLGMDYNTLEVLTMDINEQLTDEIKLELTIPCNKAYREHIENVVRDEKLVDRLYEVFDDALSTYAERFLSEEEAARFVWCYPDVGLHKLLEYARKRVERAKEAVEALLPPGEDTQ